MPLTPEEMAQNQGRDWAARKAATNALIVAFGSGSTLGLRQKKRSWNPTDQNLRQDRRFRSVPRKKEVAKRAILHSSVWGLSVTWKNDFPESALRHRQFVRHSKL